MQTSPLQQQQPPLAPPNYGPPFETGAPRPRKPKKQSNVVGLIALIASALGFIFACIPGALIVGWVLLPIAFVLAIVSLFFKRKVKWTGVTALIVSIVGTIVGFVVFSSVVATSFDNAFGSGDTTVAPPSAGAGTKDQAAAKEDTAAKSGTRENPYPIGSTISSDDWRVVINSVKLAATDAVVTANQFNDPPAKGSQYILVNYTATYVGDDADGRMPDSVSVDYVTANGTTANRFDKIVVAPKPFDTSNTLYKGGSATGNIAIEVPTATASKGVLAVRPGMLADKVFVAVK